MRTFTNVLIDTVNVFGLIWFIIEVSSTIPNRVHQNEWMIRAIISPTPYFNPWQFVQIVCRLTVITDYVFSSCPSQLLVFTLCELEGFEFYSMKTEMSYKIPSDTDRIRVTFECIHKDQMSETLSFLSRRGTSVPVLLMFHNRHTCIIILAVISARKINYNLPGVHDRTEHFETWFTEAAHKWSSSTVKLMSLLVSQFTRQHLMPTKTFSIENYSNKKNK